MLNPNIQQSIRKSYQNLQHQLPSFIPRRAQNYLVSEIAKTLAGQYSDDQRILVGEAGTGIGKSLAYLMAAIPVAKQNNRKLVISTATVALQEQLMNKDLPLYRRLTDFEFSFQLVKGRQRYCCGEKLAIIAGADAGADDGQIAMFEFKPKQSDTETLQRLYDDLNQGKWDGERDSLDSPLRDELWNSIVSDKHSCNNGLAHHRGCPFQKARSELDRADVLIANHSLVMADLDLGGGVVLSEPNNTFYVFDEAHHLPRVCRDHSSASSSLKGGASWLESLTKQLPKIIGLTDESRSSRFKNELQSHIAQLIPQLTQLTKRFDPNEFTEGVYRFEHGLLPDWLQAESKELKGHSEKALQAVGKISDLIAERVKDGQVSPRLAEPAMAELGFYINRLENFTKVWQLMAEPPREKGAPLARWLEYIADKDDFLVSVSPLEVGWQLDRMLWSQCVGAVLVSATMRALNSFDYFAREAGLSTKESDGVRYLALASPFDYPENAELVVPAFPCEPQADDYTEHLAKELGQWVTPDKGNLILFSSYWQMNKVADSLQKEWIKKGWALQVQGETSRNAILKKHSKLIKQGKTSILFGTGSFSEGLDLPGELLENVVITKIPFGVPTSPVEQAHSEYITDKGGNSFMQIVVPEASKKLIQAAGRLLRKEKDSGRVVILDRRVVTKRYGKLLLDSLPPFKRTIQK